MVRGHDRLGEGKHKQDGNAHPDLCMIYNVRADEYYEAGKSYKRLFQNIEGACQFIGALWPSL
jgi:hypothetical protein